MMKYKSMDEYFKSIPPDARAALSKIRAFVHSASPDSVEGIGWGMPMFRYKGKLLVGFAAFKDHCSFFPMGELERLGISSELKKYEKTKGGIHFPFEKPLPSSLVKKIVKMRMEMIEKTIRKKE